MVGCLVGHADEIYNVKQLVRQYNKCPIGFEYDGVQPLGNCQKCGRAYSNHPKTYTTCYNDWIVCGDCLWEYNCAMNQTKELPEAKVGNIIWLI